MFILGPLIFELDAKSAGSEGNKTKTNRINFIFITHRILLSYWTLNLIAIPKQKFD